jgi:hypothetical protein
VWTPNGQGGYTGTALPESQPPAAIPTSSAWGVSDDGIVVGSCNAPDPGNVANTKTVACCWALVGGSYHLLDLHALIFPGRNVHFSEVRDITLIAGVYEVVGISDDLNFGGWAAPLNVNQTDLNQSQIFPATQLSPPGSGTPTPLRIDPNGDIAGVIIGGGTQKATLWKSAVVGDPQDLLVQITATTNLGQNLTTTSLAGAANIGGQVAGHFVRASDGFIHPFRLEPGQLIDPADAAQDLGLLPETRAGFTNDMNLSGTVVGFADGRPSLVAWVYSDDDGLEDLNDLVPGIGSSHIHTAAAINDVGLIAGQADSGPGTARAACVLTPITAPPSPPLSDLKLSAGQNSGTSLTIKSEAAFSLTGLLASIPTADAPIYVQAVSAGGQDKLSALGLADHMTVPADAEPPSAKLNGTTPRQVGGPNLVVTIRASTTPLPASFELNNPPPGSKDVTLTITPHAVGRIKSLTVTKVNPEAKRGEGAAVQAKPPKSLHLTSGDQFKVVATLDPALGAADGDTYVIITVDHPAGLELPTDQQGRIVAVVPDGKTQSLPLIGKVSDGNGAVFTVTLTGHTEFDDPHTAKATFIVDAPPPGALSTLTIKKKPGSDLGPEISVHTGDFFLLKAGMLKPVGFDTPVYLQAIDSRKNVIDLETAFELGPPQGFASALVIMQGSAAGVASGQVYLTASAGKGKPASTVVTIQASTTPFSKKPPAALMRSVKVTILPDE